MSEKWVDFKIIKEKVSMETVLSHYGLLAGLKQTSHGFRGPCPIHKGKHPNQFHVDPAKNRWNCFGGCDMEKLEGHVIGFVAAMEGVDLRQAALMIAGWYKLSTERPAKTTARARRKSDSPPPPAEPLAPAVQAAPVPESEDEPENQGLSFELKGLSVDHPFFGERGVAVETIQHFGLGFCSRGLMKDRIVFPLHRLDGKLIGYLGRTIKEVTPENPKWLLPPGLIKPKVLFNFHRVAGQEKTVIVVEGPLDLVAVHQAGSPNVVALLGKELLSDPSLSYDQFRLIIQNFTNAVLLLDGDADGQAAAVEIAGKLAPKMFVKILSLPPDKDPSDLESDTLRQLLNS